MSTSPLAQQRPDGFLEPAGGKQIAVVDLTPLDDRIEADHQAVRWFRSWHQWLSADRKAQSDRCPDPGAGVQHGNGPDFG